MCTLKIECDIIEDKYTETDFPWEEFIGYLIYELSALPERGPHGRAGCGRGEN